MIVWMLVCTYSFFAFLSANRVFIISAILLLVVIAGFRFEVGTDYLSYASMFDSILDGTAHNVWLNKEAGFIWSINVIGNAGFGFQLLCFFYSALTIYLLYLSARFFSFDSRVMLGMILLVFIPFFYFYSLNSIRQSLSVALFLFSIRYLYHKNFLKYAAVLFIAGLFHKSAYLMFPMYWLFRVPTSRSILLLMVFSVVLLSLPEIRGLIFKIIGMLSGSYSVYFQYESLMNKTSFFGRLNTYIICVFFILLCLSFIMKQSLRKKSLLKSILFSSFFAFVIVRLIALDLSVINRIAIYYKPLMAIGLVYACFYLFERLRFNRFQSRVIFSFLVLAYTFIGIYFRAMKDESYMLYQANYCLLSDSPCLLNF